MSAATHHEDGARRYALGHPLAFWEVIHTAREAVAAGVAEGPARAALAVQGVALALLPAHARDVGSLEAWQPSSADGWLRKGAYCGVVDAWQRSQWRGVAGPPGVDGELYSCSYAVAHTSTQMEMTRRGAYEVQQ